MTATINIQEILSGAVTSASNRFQSIIPRACRDAVELGRTRLVEHTHLISAIISEGGGIGGAIIKDHLNTKEILELRQMLCENDFMKDHSTSNEYTQDLARELREKNELVGNPLDIAVFSSSFYTVIQRALKIGDEVGSKTLGTGEILAAVLDTYRSDPRVKLFIRETSLNYELVMGKLKEIYSHRTRWH